MQIVKTVRGKGLLNAIVISSELDGWTAWDACVEMAELGVLAKPTHGDIIRLAPPLVITEEQVDDCLAVMDTVIRRAAARQG